MSSNSTPTTTGGKLSADTIAHSIQHWIDDGQLTAGDKGLILWLHAIAKDRNASWGEIGTAIGVDGSTISRFMRGKYEGKLENIIAKIRRYKHLTEERKHAKEAGFVETSIWTQIRQTCDLALIHQMPSIITGISQIGKTTALLEYQRRSEYIVRYIRMPAVSGMRCVIDVFADALYINSKCTIDRLRRRIANVLDSKTLLIVDEFHQLAATGATTAIRTAEWIRELHDRSQCGLVLCGTEAVETDLFQGQIKHWMDQMAQRCIKITHLPRRLPEEDANLIAEAYGLTPPEGDAATVVRGMRTNRLVKTLMLATNLASKRGEALTWNHFLAADRTVRG